MLIDVLFITYPLVAALFAATPSARTQIQMTQAQYLPFLPFASPSPRSSDAAQNLKIPARSNRERTRRKDPHSIYGVREHGKREDDYTDQTPLGCSSWSTLQFSLARRVLGTGQQERHGRVPDSHRKPGSRSRLRRAEVRERADFGHATREGGEREFATGRLLRSSTARDQNFDRWTTIRCARRPSRRR